MAQLDDLNAAIAAEDVDIQLIADSAIKIGADVTALLAKIGSGTPPTDLTAQIAAINAHVASLKTASDQLTAADSAANPPAA